MGGRRRGPSVCDQTINVLARITTLLEGVGSNPTRILSRNHLAC